VIFWVDAQLSPQLAPWLTTQFAVQAWSLGHLGMQRAKDREIFFAARAVDAVVLTKDVDFVRLLEAHGPPPRLIWLTVGNTANDRLRLALAKYWDRILAEFAAGEVMVEIGAERER
jgi:predicted nuclease of predicted toxin-antitoxin system